MMRSLYSGVAGLRTHQTKMDVLGNNIANVNTTSYKSQSITFSDLMYQTTQTASGATATKGGVNARQIGLGAKSGAIATAIESQGATQTTNNPFDIMITGKSFFIVNNGKENLYTRDGSFYIDGAGNLAMQANGYLVQGWAAQENKETGEITVNKNGGLSPLQIMSADNSTYSPASTTQALYSGNIDDHDTNVTSDDGKTITLEFYDNKGYLYTGKFTLKDTGTDNLFSIQLKDIIDSDGNSIGAERLSGVKFGTTENKDANVDSAYEVVVGNTTSTVNLLAGATVYSKVPTSGALSDLMSSSKAPYGGILEKVYGITDDMVTGGKNGYSKTSPFTIDATTGVLTITYDQEVAGGSAKPDGYTYNKANTQSYYVQESTGKAYVVPTTTTTGDSMSNASQALKTTLINVYKDGTNAVTEADIKKYSAAGYEYAFSNVPTGSDTFTIYRDPNLAVAATPAATSKANLSKFSLDFTDLEADAEYAAYTDDVFYSYTGLDKTKLDSDRQLTVYGSKLSDAAKVEAVDATQIAELTTGGFAKDNNYEYAGLTSDQKDALATVLGMSTTELDNYMSDNGYTHIRVNELTGTPGLCFYSSVPAKVADTDNVLYQGQAFTKKLTANEEAYPVNTAAEIGAVFTSTTDYSSYILKGTEKVVGDYTPEMLNDVYGLDATSFSASYQVAIASSGQISIYQTKTTSPDLNSDYAAQAADDGTVTYVTTNDTEAWKDLPNSGNIKDLLETANGPYAGLLKKVYNQTDEDADAYGTDGTYSINSDGSITMTTGTQTIQLKFDPSTGALTTANGKANGLVNIVFDQSIPGNEAFGYQKQASDGDDVVPGHMTVDFSTVTNYNTSGSSTIKAVKGDKKSLNTGRAVGEMNGVTVSTDGQIYATYSNGQTKLLGQIASAEFANASGLSKEGDNLYASTLNSGDATIQDITTDGGYMNTGVLEMSNVDLSREFTEMITTQRGFQANSRIITVSDTLLEELTNLKR